MFHFTDFICLWCNEKGRTFYSLDAVRKHMNDKGHCKMLHEGIALAEYADFYDYSASYPDHVSFLYFLFVFPLKKQIFNSSYTFSGRRNGC